MKPPSQAFDFVTLMLKLEKWRETAFSIIGQHMFSGSERHKLP
jgi:hypothetical protein